MEYVPDNYDQFRTYDQMLEDALNLLPVCSECGLHIQSEDCYVINDEIICETCMEGFKKNTDELIGVK